MYTGDNLVTMLLKPSYTTQDSTKEPGKKGDNDDDDDE